MATAVAADKEQPPLDPLIWKACAGSSMRIPPAGSFVYYFPQGHAEQASAAPDLSSAGCDSSFFLCRLAALHFLADQDTDEVFANVRLDPRISAPAPPALPEDAGGGDGGVVSFAKVLTPSDANNGGGFSVPRFCADSIFPPLNYSEDPPVQTLCVRDMRGKAWEFRHIYRGTPRRHLLTTGWSKFVNSKKLVAGDSVVFTRSRSSELFVGVRRTARSGGAQPQVGPPAPKLAGNPGSGEGFSRSCRGRVTPEAVVDAARLAALERPFEVVYYPRVGSPEFVVRKEVVEAALRVPWSAGTRVKMAVESEDSSRTTSFQGTVSCVVRHPLPFSYSPWRTLEVNWDEPDVFQHVKRVSPWQLELVSVSPQILTPYPMIKKPRITQNQELLTDGAEQNMFFLTTDFSNVVMDGINPSVFSHSIFPAGMQGARHDPSCVSSLSNFLPNEIQQMSTEKQNGNYIPTRTSHVSTELNIGYASQSESLSSPSQNSIYYYGSELFGNSAVSNSSKVIGGSFQLFGKTIQMGQPALTDFKEVSNNHIASVRPYNLSLSHSQKQYHDEHIGPPQRVPAVET